MLLLYMQYICSTCDENMDTKGYCQSCFWDANKDPMFKRVLLCYNCKSLYNCCISCNKKYALQKQAEEKVKQEDQQRRKQLLIDTLKAMGNLTVDQIIEEVYKCATVDIHDKE